MHGTKYTWKNGHYIGFTITRVALCDVAFTMYQFDESNLSSLSYIISIVIIFKCPALK